MNRITFVDQSRSLLASALAALVMLSGSHGIANAEDSLAGDLFSKITMSDTANRSSDQKATDARSGGRAILGSVSLSSLLKSENIRCQIKGRMLLVDLANLSSDSESNATSQSRTIQLTVEPETRQILVALPICEFAADKINGTKLMSLLQKTAEIPSVHVSIPTPNGSTTTESLALATTMGNGDVTVASIKESVDRLISASSRTKPSWAAITEASQKTEQANAIATSSEAKSTQPAKATSLASTAAQPSSPSNRLPGTWSAKTGDNTAWAIRFNADGTFVMVHQQGNNNSVSKGRFAVANNKLTMNETEGVTLRGTLTFASDKSAKWSIENNSGQIALSLELRKQ